MNFDMVLGKWNGLEKNKNPICLLNCMMVGTLTIREDQMLNLCH